MDTHIIKLDDNTYSHILMSWMIHMLERKNVRYEGFVDNNEITIIYHGQKLFDIPFNYNKIKAKIDSQRG